MLRRNTSGFTLIELLIVVAIIAILAAIAVPNFLEAQTRSKVARVKADQRAIVTALEAYAADNNQYVEQADTTDADPPKLRDPNLVWGKEGQKPIAWRLSTPVAYLSSTMSVFADPFFRAFGVNQTSVVNDTRYYNYSGDYMKGRVYDASQDTDGIDAFLALSARLFQQNAYHLRSRGPDTDYERRSDGWTDYITYRGQPGTGKTGNGGIGSVYDPTNGTVSSGDLIRFGREGIK